MIDIVYEENKNRAAAYDIDKNIGEATYLIENGIWVIDHTFVDSNYKGQKIGSRLIERLVEAAKDKGVKIRPVCSFAVREFEKKKEYLDVLEK